jgi:hypothetical protein
MERWQEFEIVEKNGDVISGLRRHRVAEKTNNWSQF